MERTAGPSDQHPWGVLAGLYAFGPGRQDVELLERLARIAQRLGAPFLAEASSAVLACPSLARFADPRDWQALDQQEEQSWQALRQAPEAAWLGLALPRLLLRLPYGKDASTVEQFDFEEMPEGSPHESYLWGNPAVACLLLLAESFARRGWGMAPGDVVEIGGLPLSLCREGGQTEVKPCAEVVLGERASQAILDKGLMPLLSLRGRDVVRLARFQSLAFPAAALAGPWDRATS